MISITCIHDIVGVRGYSGYYNTVFISIDLWVGNGEWKWYWKVEIMFEDRVRTIDTFRYSFLNTSLRNCCRLVREALWEDDEEDYEIYIWLTGVNEANFDVFAYLKCSQCEWESNPAYLALRDKILR